MPKWPPFLKRMSALVLCWMLPAASPFQLSSLCSSYLGRPRVAVANRVMPVLRHGDLKTGRVLMSSEQNDLRDLTSPAPVQTSTQLFSVNGLARKNTEGSRTLSREGSRTLSRDLSTSKEPDFRWVGSLVPSDWVPERQFSASKNGENLLVGDLVVVMRSDGSMRFGEILTLNSAIGVKVPCFCSAPPVLQKEEGDIHGRGKSKKKLWKGPSAFTQARTGDLPRVRRTD